MNQHAIKPSSSPQADLDRLIHEFLAEFSKISLPQVYNSKGNEFIRKFPPQRGLEIASALSHANPFFLPDMDADSAQKLKISLELFSEITMRAKITAGRARQLNIMVACAPKSASTFIQNALSTGLGLPGASLFTSSGNPSEQGANLREQQPDELSLIRNGLNMRGYVAQHHMRCSPYGARLLNLFNVKTIVTVRNIFDTIVSMDDMLVSWRQVAPDSEGHYFDDAMPRNYVNMDFEDRITLVAGKWTPWLTQFYVSWKKCERHNFIKPFWINYENDIIADKPRLVERLATWLGPEMADGDRLMESFVGKNPSKNVRFNKGVAGRGASLPDNIRADIIRFVGYYADEEDVTPLLGD